MLADAESVFHDIEARFSRFRPDSELSAFNARSDAQVSVSAQMMQLLDLALYFTNARTACSIRRCCPRWKRPDTTGHSSEWCAMIRMHAPHEVCNRTPSRSRRCNSTAAEDAHGADGPAHRLRRHRQGLRGGRRRPAAVRHARLPDHAGGDIFASGNGPGGDGWPIGIADPANGADLDVVVLRDQAIATSTTAQRRWKRGDRWHSHIIGPAHRRLDRQRGRVRIRHRGNGDGGGRVREVRVDAWGRRRTPVP